VLGGDVLHGLGLFAHAGLGAVELEEQVRRFRQVRLSWRLIARIASASTNSTRATGTPSWMVWMVARTASPMLGKAQTAAEIASGCG
jgi:hypothetical protein